MKTTWVCAVALGLFGALAGVGCGDAEDPGASGGGDTEPVSLDAFAGEFADVYCERIYRCCDANEQAQVLELMSSRPENQEECAAELAPLLSLVSLEKKASVGAGRQSYDGEKAARCLAAVKGTCEGGLEGDDSPFDTAPECSTMFVGKVADGDACTEHDDCSGEGSVCVDDVCTPPAPPAAEGQPCYLAENCQEGLVCEYVDNGPQCVKPAFKPDGQACAGNYECASGYCDATRVCVAQREDGAECSFSGECKSLDCDTETFTCAPAEPEPEPADDEPVCDGR